MSSKHVIIKIRCSIAFQDIEIFSRKDPKYTFNNFYSLQLEKFNRFTCIKKSNILISDNKKESSNNEKNADNNNNNNNNDKMLEEMIKRRIRKMIIKKSYKRK